MDSIRDIYEVTGRFDFLIKVKAKSLEELHNTVSAKIGRLKRSAGFRDVH